MSRPTKRIARTIKELHKSNNFTEYLINRNPRNLEKLRIAIKPAGYHLEKPGRSFWNKLELSSTGKYVTAQMIHHQFGPVIEASTTEWCIKKQLFKTSDTSAYVNLAKVFAQRCLESGFNEMRSDIKGVPNGKVEKFLTTLEESGIALKEPERVKPVRPWDIDRPEKPWEVTE